MSTNPLNSIITLCLEIDRLAEQVYLSLSACATPPDLAGFWNDMAEEERYHIRYWQQLMEWSDKGMLPRIFDNPESIIAELTGIRSRCIEILEQSRSVTVMNKAFLLAFKLEFYLLHPAFETLFIYNKAVPESEEHTRDYEIHISRLFDALKCYGLASMELELLGETIHRLWEENKKMALLSNNDPLTGILNRRGIFNTINPLLHLAQRNKTVVGILMIDIDNFKEINDVLGHQAGDDILKHVAGAIGANIRASDVLGRYGGEEFLVFLSLVQAPSLAAIGEKIRQAIESNIHSGMHVTVSIGIAYGTIEQQVERDLHQLIRLADNKLYEAKAAGKNRVAI